LFFVVQGNFYQVRIVWMQFREKATKTQRHDFIWVAKNGKDMRGTRGDLPFKIGEATKARRHGFWFASCIAINCAFVSLWL
jgi:hypothetical protein